MSNMMRETAKARSLYIIGAQCTGKTTLVNALEKMLSRSEQISHECAVSSKPVVIREVARKVLKEKQFNRDDITTSPSRALLLQQHILNAQFQAEQNALGLHTPAMSYISDRSGLDPIVYAQLFVSEEAADEMLVSETWRELEHRMKQSVVILCEAGCVWLTDDGTRLMPTGMEEWMRIDKAFRDQLAARDIEYFVVPKGMIGIEERVQFVYECWMNGPHKTVADH
ncbi:AAA domain-like protein [Stemphylium lycopersici]|uniref:AAA domain-like protein n=1 Tax=Stemphylium lycopersici TaxID=183478 RepID=A0A364MTE3_STELY|nr:AAA domain-like protein [Stemphylium lycopersici]RAR02859.1 AAA domain-like protein [Stemphylium lycopersici]